MVGLLYLDRRDLATCPQDDFARLERVVARAMRALAPQLVGGGLWSSVLEQTPLQEIVRDQMLLLLDRHEWNIARVARELGVTRRTIYLRLARWGIERRKIPRSV
jgi:transcriptional regulator of acetoin/glycerol metabolism